MEEILDYNQTLINHVLFQDMYCTVFLPNLTEIQAKALEISYWQMETN